MNHIPEIEKTLDALFGVAISLENLAAAVYGRFSIWFGHVGPVAAFWKMMQADEHEHAAVLEKIRASLSREELDSPADPKLWVEAVNLQRFLSGQPAGPINSLEDAFELAHEIEFSEVNTIFRFLATRFVPFKARSEFVLSQITRHQKKISSFSREFGGRAWRLRIQARH